MKLIKFSVIFLSTAMAVFAHPGHGIADSGIMHYLASAMHIAPLLIAAAAIAIVAFKKKQTSKESVRSKHE